MFAIDFARRPVCHPGRFCFIHESAKLFPATIHGYTRLPPTYVSDPMNVLECARCLPIAATVRIILASGHQAKIASSVAKAVVIDVVNFKPFRDFIEQKPMQPHSASGPTSAGSNRVKTFAVWMGSPAKVRDQIHIICVDKREKS